jgi:hypothetical protein
MATLKKFNDNDVFQKCLPNAHSLEELFTSRHSKLVGHLREGNNKNCSKTLIIPSLLALAGCLVGPGTSIKMESTGFKSVLNQFIIAVCDPGGGKTNTFERVIAPCLDKISSLGKDVQLDFNATQQPGSRNTKLLMKGKAQLPETKDIDSCLQ